VVHQKTTGFLGWSTKPRPKNRRRCSSSSRPVWPVGLTGLTGESDRWVPVWPVRSTDLTGVRQRSPESSKRRTRVRIAWLALRPSRVRLLGICPMEKIWRLPKPPFRGLYP
jgi:hypothetical protein